jgi:hypothetical protein
MINYICNNNTKLQPRLVTLFCWIGETKKDNVSHIYKLAVILTTQQFQVRLTI